MKAKKRVENEVFFFLGYRVLSSCCSEDARQIISSVVSDRIDFLKVFRDNKRTFSALFSLNGQKHILKIPRARNARLWEKVLSFLRSSESYRTYLSQQHLIKVGFRGPKPILAVEKRRWGCVCDSFIVYEYIEGVPAQEKDAQTVLNTLLALHQKGYVRNDPQLMNFIVSEGDIQFIDFKLKKPVVFASIRLKMELASFIQKCPSAQKYLPVHILNSQLYRAAAGLSLLKDKARGLRRSLKKRF